ARTSKRRVISWWCFCFCLSHQLVSVLEVVIAIRNRSKVRLIQSLVLSLVSSGNRQFSNTY
uniref:Uncharacterized protein n=1 Tax=Parascaris univalens TaxID=6257 RepID=A0A915A1T5_PARUN